MTHRITTDGTAAVATDYYWMPMRTCPIGVKVQLDNPGGVAIYGQWDGKDPQFKGWAPCPKRRPA